MAWASACGEPSLDKIVRDWELADAGLKQRFYELATDDQIAPLVFVTPQTYARARRRGLL